MRMKQISPAAFIGFHLLLLTQVAFRIHILSNEEVQEVDEIGFDHGGIAVGSLRPAVQILQKLFIVLTRLQSLWRQWPRVLQVGLQLPEVLPEE